MKNTSLAFSAFIVAFILFLIAVIVYLSYTSGEFNNNQQQVEQTQKNNDLTFVRWEYENEEWKPQGVAPECPLSFEIDLPVDPSLPDGVLYPGQYRGGDYKSHGGLRFDSIPNGLVNVTAPLDAYLIEASRYFSGAGDVQYLLFFQHPCGIMYRLDHIAVLSPEIATIVKDIPEPRIQDSRTTPVGPYLVKKDDLIGTKVGIISQDNIFFDFGIYDLRKKNYIATVSNVWAEETKENARYSHNGVCWPYWLNQEESQRVLSLPTGMEGSDSDYCL